MSKFNKQQRNAGKTRSEKIPNVNSLFFPRTNRLGSNDEPEPKFFDAGTGGTILTWNGFITSLSLIPQGNGQSQRLGDEVQLLGLELHFSANNPVADTARVILVQSCTPAALAIADVVDAAGLGVNAAPVVRYNYVQQRQRAWNILLDKVIQFGTATVPLAGEDFIKRIPLNSRIRYNAGATLGEGSLYLICIGTLAAAGANIQAGTRVFYLDG
jgi:hypothetical protein